MVWSKELEKLRQGMKGQGEAPPAPPPPTTTPSAAPKSLEEEDELFLASMGRPKPHLPGARPSPGGGAEFTEAMSQMRGLKPRAPGSAEASGGESPAPESGAVEPPAPADPDAGASVQEAPAGGDPQARKLPEKIQLAAGMVIEVDGVLDLRNHNAVDAEGRLSERVLDGVCLGWRSLHVILGNSDPLQQVFADYIASPSPPPLAKYAQAPVPMGGSQAWILYYGANSNREGA